MSLAGLSIDKVNLCSPGSLVLSNSFSVVLVVEALVELIGCTVIYLGIK